MGIVINHSENIFLRQVAIVYDYDSLASFRIQRQSILLDPAEP